jgi:nucleotide-binding universal stress UspA family protein
MPWRAPCWAQVQEELFMTTTAASSAPSAPTVYLVAVDGSDSATHVLEVACDLGAALAGAAELHVVHVVPSPHPTTWLASEAAVTAPDPRPAARALLDRSAAHAAARFRGRLFGHLGSGDAWRSIVGMAGTLNADLIVVGTAGRTGVNHLLLGSVAEQVVRHAGCPVLVVRPKDHPLVESIGIEPPCPDCLATQKSTARATLWCARHSEVHPHGNLHYELPKPFALGSMNFRP